MENIFTGNAILAIVIAFVVFYLLGRLRYGPLFGKTWMKAKNLKGNKPNAGQMLFGALMMLLMVIGLYRILSLVGMTFLWQTLCVTWLLVITFMVLPFFADTVWSKTPWKVVRIDTFYNLISFSIAVVIFSIIM